MQGAEFLNCGAPIWRGTKSVKLLGVVSKMP